MLETTLRWTAITCSAVVFFSWGMFVIDQTRAASNHTTEEIAGHHASQTADPSPEQERAREQLHSTPREALDDANDVLISPFASIGSASPSRWVRRSVPMMVAVLLYGFGVGYLARFASGRAHSFSAAPQR